MNKLLSFIKIILKCGMIFLILFIWLRFVLSSLWLSIGLATILTILIEFISIFFKRKNDNKSYLKIKEKEEAENMFLSLITDKNNINFFLDLCKSRHSNSKIKDKYILIEHFDKTKVILYPFMLISSLKEDNILTILRECQLENPNKIVIICNDYEKTCDNFIKNLNKNITILNKYETYSLLYKEYDFYPEITEKYKKEGKIKIKDLIAYSFNKSRTKGYLFASFIIFSSSYFVGFKIYYLIIGTLLLLFALISFINPKFNTKKEQTIL